MKFVLKTRDFHRWMRKTQLDDQALMTAIGEMVNGLVDADLGGNLYKKRMTAVSIHFYALDIAI